MRIFLFLIALCVSGCGFTVPEKDPFSKDIPDPPKRYPDGTVLLQPSPQGKIEDLIIADIQCELARGIWQSSQMPGVAWLASKRYGTAVSLKLSIDEQTTADPGVTLTKPFGNAVSSFANGNVTTAQSFALGLGFTGQAHSTRIETIQFTDANDELAKLVTSTLKKEGSYDCAGFRQGMMIEGDLGIAQFIYDKASIASAGTVLSPPSGAPPFNVFQEEITFVATYGGSVSPTWKLLRITTNPSSELLSASRSKTDDLIISIGPLGHPATINGPAQLSSDAQMVHQSALIGSATALSNQASAHP
jgi:hypothetical protein